MGLILFLGALFVFSSENVQALQGQVAYRMTNDVLQEKFYETKIDNKISLDQQNASVEDALQQTITGSVTDANTGEALPGVTVVVPGTSTGTTSDIDGDYSLTVPNGTETLAFSYVGYLSQEVQINGRTEINIELQEEVIALDEAVVTAFGLERSQRSITSSVGQLTGEQLTQTQNINVANALAGRIAGVDVDAVGTGPGGSSRVIIRGFSSLQGNNQPLYVVDGVPIDNSSRGDASGGGGRDHGDGIQNINPNDIADISVLKGPGAASLYGQRGANGVILITTKSGQAQEGISLELNSSVTVGTPMVWPDWQNTYGAGTNNQFRFYRDTDGNINSRLDWQNAGSPGSWTPQLTTANNGPQYPVTWGPRMEGQEVYNWDSNLTTFTPQPDNAKDFFQNEITADNTIALSGGNETTTFHLSLQDVRAQGMVPTNELTRNGVNLRGTHQVTDRLRADAKINYIRQEAYNRPSLADDQDNFIYVWREMPRNIKLATLKDYKIGPDDRIIGYPSNIHQVGFPKTPTSSSFAEQPYWAINEMPNEDTRERVIGFVNLGYEFTDWIHATVRAETDYYVDRRHSHQAIGTRTGLGPTGIVDDQVHRFREDNFNFLITAEQNVTEGLVVTGNIGGNYQRNFFENTSQNGSSLAAPGLYVIGNAQLQNPGYSLSEYEIQSLYAFGQFNWKDFWYVDWSVRNDWASTLPEDANSFMYPSVGTNIVFSDILDLPDALSYGSVRVSWAQAGSSADPYQLTGTYGIASNPHLGNPGANFTNSIPFVDLKNELSTSYEVGADLRFFDGRLRLDGNWYSSVTENQILNIPVSRASGYTNRAINAGEITNKGIELLITGTPVSTSELQWDVTFNYGRNKNEVIELTEGIDRFQIGGAQGVTVFADPGEPFGNIWTDIGRWLRDDEGNRLIGPDGLPIRESGQFVIGNAMPDWNGGFSSNLSYNNFTFSFHIDMQYGGDIYSESVAFEVLNGTTKRTLEGRDGTYVAEGVVAQQDGNGNWVSTGQENTQQVSAQDYWLGAVARSERDVLSEEFLFDATYVKMREVRIGYNLPVSLVSSIGLSQVQMAVFGNNLFYFFRDTDGFSPDSHSYNATSSSLGVESKSYPTMRTVGFNVRIGL